MYSCRFENTRSPDRKRAFTDALLEDIPTGYIYQWTFSPRPKKDIENKEPKDDVQAIDDE